MKHLLVRLFWLAIYLAGQTAQAQGTLHSIIASASNDPAIGDACQVDARVMEDSMLRQMADSGGLGFRSHRLVGRDFSRANTQATLDALRVGRNDVVVFYFSGHGQCEQGTDGCGDRLLIFPDGNLSTRTVADLLVEKGARLNILLADCCSDGMQSTDPYPVKPGNGMGAANECANMRALLQFRGTLKGMSSRCGERSFCYVNGGFYTRNFLRSFWNIVGEDAIAAENAGAVWKLIMRNTTSSVEDAAKDKMRVQRPVFCFH